MDDTLVDIIIIFMRYKLNIRNGSKYLEMPSIFFS